MASKRFFPTRPLLLLVGLAFVPACSSSASPGAASTDAGADAAATTADAGASPSTPVADADSVADASVPPAYLRVVQLSPDAPPLDFCVAVEGDAFVGPILGTAAGAAYGAATAYFPFAADFYYDVRLVPAGARDCTTAAAGTYAQSLSTLVSGTYTTLALAGDLTVLGDDASFAETAYTDEPSGSGDGVALRFVNASSNLGSVDFGTGSLAASSFSPVVTRATFTGTGRAASPDAGATVVMDVNGYVDVPTPAAAIVSAHATGGTTDAVAGTLTGAKGATLTLFLLGGKPGDAAHPNQLLACTDGPAAGGVAATCMLLGK